jgi:hypothetical protein
VPLAHRTASGRPAQDWGVRPFVHVQSNQLRDAYLLRGLSEPDLELILGQFTVFDVSARLRFSSRVSLPWNSLLCSPAQ